MAETSTVERRKRLSHAVVQSHDFSRFREGASEDFETFLDAVFFVAFYVPRAYSLQMADALLAFSCDVAALFVAKTKTTAKEPISAVAKESLWAVQQHKCHSSRIRRKRRREISCAKEKRRCFEKSSRNPRPTSQKAFSF